MLDRNIAPPVSDFTNLVMPPREKMTLDNGLVLNIMNQGTQDVFNLTAVWRGGVAECRSSVLPMMTLATMREGAGILSGEEFSDALEFNGARILTSADTHYSTIRLYALSSKAAEVIPMMCDMCTCPLLPVSAFEMQRERQARQAEIMLHKVEFNASRWSNLLMMGKEHPVAKTDTPDFIEQLTIDDLRKWYSQIFVINSENVELFIAGRITPELIDIVNHTFGAKTVCSDLTKLRIDPFRRDETMLLKHIVVDGSLQSGVRISYPGPLRDNPDYIKVRILMVALGGYFGSRLMSNIREDKGLTYGISSFLMGYPEGGIIGIESSTDPATADILVDETLKEVDRLSSGDFTPGEIKRLRRHLMSGLASSLDSPFDMMDYYITCKLSHIPPMYFERQVEEINSLSPEILAETARCYVEPYSPTVVVAGK